MAAQNRLVLGWEEWVGLPELGLPALIAKVDTGARTSALHAFAIETFGRAERPRVRFGVNPIPGRSDIEVYCSADVIDQRAVMSSNGETEKRFVIGTRVAIGGRDWPIEVTLTNREAMAYRMLIGRQAIGEDTLVNPGLSFQQPILGYEIYDLNPPANATRRALRILLLTREPGNYSNGRLKAAAEQRGHELEMIDTSRCVMAINAEQPGIYIDDKPLAHYDAVVPRIGASMTVYGLAVLRQLAAMGCFCLSTPDAIAISRDKLLAHQTLARFRLPMPTTAYGYSVKDNKTLLDLAGGPPVVIKLLTSTQGRGVMLAETAKSALSAIGALRSLDANFLVQQYIGEAAGADIRCFVIGGKVVAAMQRQSANEDFRANVHLGGSAVPVRLDKEERRLASRAARALGLAVAGVDLIRSKNGPKVLEVNSSPGLEGIEAISGKDIAGLIVDHIAANVKSLVLRPEEPAAAIAETADEEA